MLHLHAGVGDELVAGGFQTLGHHLHQTAEKLVAEFVVFVALGTQGTAVHSDDLGILDGPGIEAPLIGGHQPGPAQDVAGLE